MPAKAGIHVFFVCAQPKKNVDGRSKSGHDEKKTVTVPRAAKVIDVTLGDSVYVGTVMV